MLEIAIHALALVWSPFGGGMADATETRRDKLHCEGRALKILIADDEPQIRSLLGRFLEGLGHRVVLAENGVEAWEHLTGNSSEIEIVLADIKMRGIDGRELLRRIREAEMKVEVLLISGQINVTNEDAVKAGAHGIIHKPFELTSIMDVLQELPHPDGGK